MYWQTKCAALATILMLFPSPALPHPGGLDANGGHHSRSGGYHYHQRKPVDRGDATSLPRQSSLSPARRDRLIGEYFRTANENVGALSCRLHLYPREVPGARKEAVKRRDGHRCVICGSRERLEVDHKRALMNGGNNSVANLATLCDDCHTIKTRMDNSLRRKRDRICRGG